jgi:hypothetical protein
MSKIIKLATELVPEVAQSVANEAKELLDMRAVRMVVPCNFPVGCIPKLHVHRGEDPLAYDPDFCLSVLNSFAELQNAPWRACVGRTSGPACRGSADNFDVGSRTCARVRARFIHRGTTMHCSSRPS